MKTLLPILFATVAAAAACSPMSSSNGKTGAGGSTGAAGRTGSGNGGSSATGAGGVATTGAGGTVTTGAGGSGGTTNTPCTTTTKLMNPVLLDFRSNDGSIAPNVYAEAFGGATPNSGTSYTGVYSYPEVAGGTMPTLNLVAGHPPTMWGVQELLHATNWGMGGGVWVSCNVDASAYSGVSFWARGTSGTGTMSFSIGMPATTLPADGGTCPGTTDTCKAPAKTDIPLTIDWTQVQIRWADFTPGMSGTTSVVPNGNNINGLGWSVPLQFVLAPGATDPVAGPYNPVPADVSIDLSDFAFMP
jgi:hypothetical protein